MLLDWMKAHPGLADDPVSGFDPAAVTVSETVDIAAPARVVWAVSVTVASTRTEAAVTRSATAHTGSAHRR